MTVIPKGAAPRGTAEAAEALLSRHSVRTVRVEWCDLHGLARGKRLSRPRFQAALARGLPQSTAPLFMDLHGNTVDAGERYERAGWPDMLAWPDLQTLRLAPHEEGCAVAVADLADRDGQPLPAPRQVLKRVLERAGDSGWAFDVAAELEFYLFSGRDLGRLPPGKQALRTRLGREEKQAVRRMWDALAAMGFTVEACCAEDGPGQFEINLACEDPLTTADGAFLFRNVVKEIAAQEGLFATFMAKPLPDESGNGLHVHVGVDCSASRHSMGECDAAQSPTPECRAFIAGQLTLARELAALWLPTVNAYKRAATRNALGRALTWGRDNRTAAVRLVDTPGQRLRIENRIPGADANPYLAIAATLVAGVVGFERGLTPAPPLTDAGERREDATPTLPEQLGEAAELLAASEEAGDWLGQDFVHLFVGLKRAESRRFATAVTDWEHQEYSTYL